MFLIAIAILALNSNNVTAISTGNSSLANLTIWDDTDTIKLFNTNTTLFYANWTNLTTGKSINNSGVYCNLTFSFLADAPFNMTWNSSLLLYTYSNIVRTGQNNYTIICDGTLLNYGLVNVTDLVNITNRAPGLAVNLPDVVINEEDSNLTINMSNYFGDDDLHELNYSVTVQDGNISVYVDNGTKLLNITGTRDFYGVRTANVTAFDGYGGNATSNTFTITANNLIEINLSVPKDTASGFTADDFSDILVVVEDDYNITSCSLLINDTVNVTVSNPDIGALQEVKYDDGGSESSHKVGAPSGGVITKHLNTTTTDMKFLAFYMQTTGNPSNMNISINNQFWRNFTNTEFLYSCPAEPCWIYLPIDNQSLLIAGQNNVSFDITDAYNNGNRWEMQVDTTANSGMSSNTGTTPIGNDEYMVRFHNVTNIVNFSNVGLTRGSYSYNVNCTNDNGTSNTAVSDFTFTVDNSAPSVPTISPSSGTFDEEVNISCLSTDVDGDSLTYDIEYYDVDSAIYNMLSEDDSDGNYTWNTSTFANEFDFWLRCTADDTTNTSTDTVKSLQITHTGAPSTPTNLSCDNGECSAHFNNTVNLTATGTNDSNSQFSYYFRAKYDDVNGTIFYDITSVAGLNTSNNTTTIVWNISILPSPQTVLQLEVYAGDGTYNSTPFILVNNLTINNTNAPSIPLNLTNLTGGSYNEGINIPIQCNGSTSPIGSDLQYNIHALYDDSWHELNTTLNNTTTFNWNFTDVPEQTINISCQAHETNGIYVSSILRTAGINLIKPPTLPTNITPSGNDADNVYEYAMNYSCSGSNNSDYFDYAIEMNYSNGSSIEFRTLNDSFPAVLPVNESTLAYDDNSYWSTGGTKKFTVNVSNHDYSFCVRGHSSGTGGSFTLDWDCNNLFETCLGTSGSVSLSTTETEYCYDGELTRDGIKRLSLSTSSTGSTIQYIDSVILTAKPIEFNITNITPQKNVQLRCLAKDGAGNSSYLYSNNTIIIDRKPVYNGTYNVTNALSFRTDQTGQININNSFYDPDTTDNLTFYVDNTSASLIVTYNFTDSYVITFSSGTVGTYYVDLIADDGLANTTQNVSISVTTSAVDLVGGGGSSSSRSVAAVKAAAGETAKETTKSDTPTVLKIETPQAQAESSGAARLEEPKELTKKEELLEELKSIKLISTREYEIGFGRTKVFETLKNIDVGELYDVKAVLTISKDIVNKASEIIKVNDFLVLEEDPKIMFQLGDFKPGEKKKIQYIFPTELDKALLTKDNLKLEFEYKQLSAQEIAEREQKMKEMIEKAKETVNITVKYEINNETGSADIIIDVSLLDKKKFAKDLAIVADIPKCLIEFLSEEFKKKNIKSTIDFDVIKEDPMTMLNLGDIDADKQFRISIEKIKDINCDEEIESEAFVKEFITEATIAWGETKLEYILYVVGIIILILFALVYFPERSEHVDKERASKIQLLVRRVRKLRKTNKKLEIKKILCNEGYSKEIVHHTLKNYHKEYVKALFSYALSKLEFIILFIALTANFFEAFGILPPDYSFYKAIASFTAVGYLIYKISMTKVLFGHEIKRIDLLLVLAFFLMLSKTTLSTLNAYLAESSSTSNFILWLLQLPALGEHSMLLGFLALAVISLYLAKKLNISDISLASLVLKPGKCDGKLDVHSTKRSSRYHNVNTLNSGYAKENALTRSVLCTFLKRSVSIFLILSMFYIAVYQLLMEWFTIIIDSIVMVVIALALLYIFIVRKRKKKAVSHTIEESEAVTTSAYKTFFKLFRFHKTALLALAFIAVAFAVTDAFVYIVPYTFGLEQSDIYFSAMDESTHTPIFNIFNHENLFSEHKAGLPVHGLIVLFLLYLFNVAGMFSLMFLPIIILVHIYKNIDLPIRHADKSDLPTWTVSLFLASAIAMLLTPVFTLKKMGQQAVAGVDIQTHLIHAEFIPNWLGVLVCSVIIGYMVLHALKKVKAAKLDNAREEHHYIIFSGLFLLCIGYILSFIDYLGDKKILFITDYVEQSPTFYLMFVFALSAITGYLVFHYSKQSRRNELTFEYITSGSIIMFFLVYYIIYLSDIFTNHIALFVGQASMLELTSAFNYSMYLRFGVLLVVGFMYLLEFVMFIGTLFALGYTLYTRNELGLHKYNIPFFLKLEEMYDISHAGEHIARHKKKVPDKHLKLLMDKIAKGIKDRHSEEKVIGHMLEHDWEINTVHEAVLRLNITKTQKRALLYALYEFYSEKIQSELRAEETHPIVLSQHLSYFDCPMKHIEFEIYHSKLTEAGKKEVLDELKKIKKAKEKYHATKDEKEVVSILEKELEPVKYGLSSRRNPDTPDSAHAVNPALTQSELNKSPVKKDIFLSVKPVVIEQPKPEPPLAPLITVHKNGRKKSWLLRLFKRKDVKETIMDRLDKNHEVFEIVAYLQNQGYKDEKIETALMELELNPAYKEKVRHLKHEHSRNARIKDMKKFIKQRKKYNVPLSITIDQAKKKGWKEADIAKALKSIKFRNKEDREISKYLSLVHRNAKNK